MRQLGVPQSELREDGRKARSKEQFVRVSLGYFEFVGEEQQKFAAWAGPTRLHTRQVPGRHARPGREIELA